MKLDLDEAELQPIIVATVAATLDQLQADRQKLDGRLAYSEPEAAALLGLRPHVLRDCRLRGELDGRRVGKRILYPRDELLRFLANPNNNGHRPGRAK